MARYEGSLEIPDPRPIAVPAHLRMPETLAETMKRLIRVELSRQAVEQGNESFEEADDFEVESDEIVTPYELRDMQPEYPVGTPPPAEDKQETKAEEKQDAADGSQVQAADGKEAEEKG